MLPTIHPKEKTLTEVKRSIQRLELYAKSNEDVNVLSAISLLKSVLEKLK